MKLKKITKKILAVLIIGNAFSATICLLPEDCVRRENIIDGGNLYFSVLFTYLSMVGIMLTWYLLYRIVKPLLR